MTYYIWSIILTDSNNSENIYAENAKKALEAQGYEVQSFFLLWESPRSESLVVMKSLGNREEQLWQGASYLALVYPDVDRHTVDILTEQEECSYSVSGELFRAYHDAIDNNRTIWNGEDVRSSDLGRLIRQELSVAMYCE